MATENENTKSEVAVSALGPGTTAPTFTLQSRPDQQISLNDFRGRPVILAFLSRRLEPSVRRPNGPVQRNPL
jgi:cytochrome oxidase Cu insertion factor (SCO1/SenC/PrrC family)